MHRFDLKLCPTSGVSFSNSVRLRDEAVTVEHRWGTRLSSAHVVRVRTRSGLMAPAVVRNISVSGAFLETAAPLRQSAHLDLQLFPPQSRLRSVDAYVVRADPQGFGIEWCELAPPAVQRLIEALVSHEIPAHAPVSLLTFDSSRRA
jgi:hypothetical protein